MSSFLSQKKRVRVREEESDGINSEDYDSDHLEAVRQVLKEQKEKAAFDYEHAQGSATEGDPEEVG